MNLSTEIKTGEIKTMALEHGVAVAIEKINVLLMHTTQKEAELSDGVKQSPGDPQTPTWTKIITTLSVP